MIKEFNWDTNFSCLCIAISTWRFLWTLDQRQIVSRLHAIFLQNCFLVEWGTDSKSRHLNRDRNEKDAHVLFSLSHHMRKWCGCCSTELSSINVALVLNICMCAGRTRPTYVFRAEKCVPRSQWLSAGHPFRRNRTPPASLWLCVALHSFARFPIY